MGPQDCSPSEFIVALPVNHVHGGVPINANDSPQDRSQLAMLQALLRTPEGRQLRAWQMAIWEKAALRIC